MWGVKLWTGHLSSVFVELLWVGWGIHNEVNPRDEQGRFRWCLSHALKRVTILVAEQRYRIATMQTTYSLATLKEVKEISEISFSDIFSLVYSYNM